jgi:hypothetical protein
VKLQSKHSITRWLSLEPAARRILEQWDGVINYFLKHIPLKKTELFRTNSYKNTVTLLKLPTIKAELNFVVASAKLFIEFTKPF